nr:nucleotidyltransferase-like protein [Natronobacillus azotifigens]
MYYIQEDCIGDEFVEDLLRPIYQERASDSNTLGIIMMERKVSISPITDNFDVILLVIVSSANEPWFVKHYQMQEKTAAMHIVEESQLNYWMDTGFYRRILEWVTNGQVLFDRNEYVSNLRLNVEDFPEKKRELRMAIEFAKLTRSYREAKQLFAGGHTLDTYNKVLSSLHSLGRLAIIEKGYHPELVVWSQLKRIDPATYKLYEELLTSDEEMEKRLELMLLAIDFAISGRTKVASKHLLDVMRTKKETWAFGDLKIHPSVEPYQLDLSMMMDYLIEKNFIRVEKLETKGKGVCHLQYQVNE